MTAPLTPIEPPDGIAGQSLGAAFCSAAIPKWFKVSESENGHVWGRRDGWEWETCLICMAIRRRDRKNDPCKGAHKLRSLPMTADSQLPNNPPVRSGSLTPDQRI